MLTLLVADERVVVRPRLDELRHAELQDAVGLPQAVETHVAEASGAVGVPAAIDGERVVRMVGTIEFGPLPQCPVEARRHRRSGLVVLLHALRPERTVGPVVHFADRADDARLDPGLERVPVRGVAVGEQVRRRRAFARRLQRAAELVEHAGHRLVRDRRLALLQRGDVDAAVLVIRRDVDDALDVGLLLEHLAVVLVGPDAARGTILLLVVGLHDPHGDVAAAADARCRLAPCRVFEEAADPGAVAPLAPIDVVLRVLVGIDDGHELQIGPVINPVLTWRCACIPQPTWASRIMSLGGMNPCPPSTRRGTMVSADAAPRPPRKVRRSNVVMAESCSAGMKPRFSLPSGWRCGEYTAALEDGFRVRWCRLRAATGYGLQATGRGPGLQAKGYRACRKILARPVARSL